MRNPQRVTVPAVNRALERIRIMESQVIPHRSAASERALRVADAGPDDQVRAMVDEVGTDLEQLACAYWSAQAGVVHANEELACSRLRKPASAAQSEAIEHTATLLRGTTGLLREILSVTENGVVVADDLRHLITSRLSELTQMVGGESC